MALLVLCYVVTLSFIGFLLYDKRRFDKDRDSIPHRIHVNGIRGKSSVTRYVAAVLRDAGLKTYAKTTGTEARVILANALDAAIARPGHANVNEQVGIIRSFAARKAQAIVMECMAINPDYQDWLESKVMHSQITIITNVRIDHQEEMGETLTDIAHSLSRSIPRDGIVITADSQLEVLDIFAQECSRKNSKLILAPVNMVRPYDLMNFHHVAHPDNIAIGLAVAHLFNIPPEQALQSMATAPPDPGAFHLERILLDGKDIVWANLFAVNDKESFAQLATMLAQSFPNHYRIVMLNNRHDRPSRVEMFSELAQNEYQGNAIVALGDYEERVRDSVSRKDVTVALMGNDSKYANSSGNRLLKTIIDLSTKPKILLVGTVNIHTHQSERIMAAIDTLTGDNSHHAVPYYRPRARKRVIKEDALPGTVIYQPQAYVDPIATSSQEPPRGY